MSLLSALFDGDEQSTRERLETLEDEANDRLDTRVDTDAAPVTVEEFGVTASAVVNEGPDDEPVVVPVVRFAMPESREQLDRDAAWTVVPETLRVLHETYDDAVFVRHYDVQFAYDGDELFEAREVDRIAVAPDTVQRLVAESGFDGDDLRGYVEREDDIDDEIAPVAWGDAADYGADNSAVVVSTAAVGASAAACGGAAGAGAGACGAAGGT
ncbi:hypothetical protein RYH80_02980 [Halobaculum sp. MBLA0147]|uniref:hypothetical protein n=1 Tax=Halobaculum sp. MBLA0147 TaxID=3079934 RepID=UPI003523A4B5